MAYVIPLWILSDLEFQKKSFLFFVRIINRIAKCLLVNQDFSFLYTYTTIYIIFASMLDITFRELINGTLR